MIARILVGVFLSTWPSLALAFTDSEDLSRWMTFYYTDPHPERLEELLADLQRLGVLNGDSAAPIYGFVAGVVSRNPALAPSAGKSIATLSAAGKQVDELWRKHGARTSEIPLDRGPWVLDALWGYFMATGDEAAVQRIASALPWAQVRGDIPRLVIGGAARWSLASNAAQHARVMEILVREVEHNPSPHLKEVIDQARADAAPAKKSEPAPTPAPASAPGEFSAILAVTDKYDDFIAQWERPAAPGYLPQMSTTSKAVRGQIVHALVFFSNCGADADGNCETVGDFKVLKPDGTYYARVEGRELGKGKASSRDVVVKGASYLRIRFEHDDPLGVYTIAARVRDRGTGRDLELTRTVELGEGR